MHHMREVTQTPMQKGKQEGWILQHMQNKQEARACHKQPCGRRMLAHTSREDASRRKRKEGKERSRKISQTNGTATPGRRQRHPRLPNGELTRRNNTKGHWSHQLKRGRKPASADRRQTGQGRSHTDNLHQDGEQRTGRRNIQTRRSIAASQFQI